MPNKKDTAKKPTPLHEALPDMITDTAIRDDVAGFRRLLKIVEQVKIPDNHATILEAVGKGWEIIKDSLECDVMMAEGTLEMEIHRHGMMQDAQDEADFAVDEEKRKEQQDEAELEKIETEGFDFPSGPTTEVIHPFREVVYTKHGPTVVTRPTPPDDPHSGERDTHSSG